MANEFKAKNGVITPTIQSTVATGTAPLTVASTTVVTNLNADLLDGNDSSYYLNASNIQTGYVTAVHGGTGLYSYAVGDILYADTTTTIAKLPQTSTGYVLTSSGTGSAPAYNKVGLTTHVSGTLPVANGGTNASTAGIAAFNNITGYSAAGATGTTSTNLVFSTSPTLVTPILGTPQSVTLTNGTGLPLSSGVTGTLPIANGGTALTTTPTNGQLLIGNGTNYTLATLTAGTNITITNSSGGITIAASGGSSVSAATPSALGTVYGFYDSTYGSVGFGIGTLNSNSTTGRYNTGLGYQALYSSVSNNNVGVGYQALYSAAGVQATSGMKNTAVGYQAGWTITTGNYNTFIGHEAGKNTGTAVTENTLVGASAGTSATGNLNVIIGSAAASGASFSGGTNVVIGADAGTSLTSGGTNVFIGYQAGKGATTGGSNVAIGHYAANGTLTGTGNVLVGRYAGYQITSGSGNVILGGQFGGYSSTYNIDTRTTNNNVVITNGDGTPVISWNTQRVGVLHSVVQDRMTKNSAAATGTINFDILNQGVLWYTGGATGATGNWTINVRGDSSNTFQSQSYYQGGNPEVCGVTTIVFLVTNLSTAYYPTGFQIDGTSRTVKWQGGTAPSAGNTNSVDMYTYTIVRLGDGYGYDVYGSQTKFA